MAGNPNPFAHLTLAAQQRTQTLLAVFAHPDDETVVAPLLARYARMGVIVRLAIATDGRNGVRERTGIPAGEALAKARAEEARCAAERLGIQPPSLLGLEDGAVATFANLARLQEWVTKLFRDLRPDVVITFGPEGAYGHPDHRMVGNVVTQVFQVGGEGWPRRHFYPGFSSERLRIAPPWKGPSLHPVKGQYLTTRIPYRQEDFKRSREAFACYKTQFTKEEMDSTMLFLERVNGGMVYLRPWSGTGKIKTDLFK
jgi:LmbE family N-acetylglucosaminyl deacetylase